MTSPDRHSRAQELFEEAEVLPADERDAFLRAACADDSDLRREVSRLLEAAAEMPEDFLEPARLPPPPRVGLGEALAHYKILDRLGAGGMGDVYLAEDEHLKRRVALKVLPPELAASPQRLARFQREAETVAALNHPNIVTIYSIENAGGVHFLTMELVEGRSLRELIDDSGTLPVDQVLDLGTQIAEGLAEAHAAGIVHRDLKPGNVMVAPNGRVKLLDFGLALPDQPLRDASRSAAPRSEGKRPLTREGTILGTVAYMSPEQLMGRRADFRSDLFSLGVLLFELASGRHPFPAETETSRLAKILEREPADLLGIRPELPPPLERIVGRCLAKDPAERYQDPAELARELGELRLAESSGGLPARALRRRYPVRPSRKFVIAAMALSGLALIAVVIWYVFLRPPPDSLAVLPMHNISDNPDESDYLARGISEAVTTKLARAGLPVTPWDTVRRIDPARSVEEIASELGVEALLAGTLRIVEDRLHTTHELIDLKRNRVIAIGDFHGPFEDIFAIQRQVALRVSEELEAQLTAPERKVLEEPESRNADAYDYYLQGVDFLREGHRQATEVAREYFRRALALDPELVDAHIGLGAAHSTLYFNMWGGLDDLRTAEESYLAALQLEPASMRARRGLIHVEGERGHAAEVLIHAREARRLGHPNDVENLFTQAEAYTYAGLTDVALPVFSDIVALDPLNEAASWWLVIASAWAGDFDGAVEAGQAYLDEFGDDSMVNGWLGVSFYRQGDRDRAEEHYRKAIGSTPGLTSNLASLAASLNRGHLLQEAERRAEALATWKTALRTVRSRQAEVSSSPRLVFLRAAFEVCLFGKPSDEVSRHLSTGNKQFAAEVFQLAAVYARQGDWDRSTELLHWALDQGSTFPVWTGHFWSFGLDPESPELAGFRRALDQKRRELRRRFGPHDPLERNSAR